MKLDILGQNPLHEFSILTRLEQHQGIKIEQIPSDQVSSGIKIDESGLLHLFLPKGVKLWEMGHVSKEISQEATNESEKINKLGDKFIKAGIYIVLYLQEPVMKTPLPRILQCNYIILAVRF